MKLYKKIDMFFNGDYICSTNQSKTCKQAIQNYLESIETRSHSLGGVGLVEGRILKNKQFLKARFERCIK